MLLIYGLRFGIQNQLKGAKLGSRSKPKELLLRKTTFWKKRSFDIFLQGIWNIDLPRDLQESQEPFEDPFEEPSKDHSKNILHFYYHFNLKMTPKIIPTSNKKHIQMFVPKLAQDLTYVL